MSLTIAQALKEKNKKLQLLAKLWRKLESNNSIPEGNVRTFQPEEILVQLREETEAYIALKTRIHLSCDAVREKIFRLSELKSFVKRLKALNTDNGFIRNRYDSSLVKYEAFYSEAALEERTDALEAEIEAIQEELDHFNHTHYLQ